MRKTKQARKELVFKTAAHTYEEVLSAMRSKNRLSPLGTDVISIWRIRTGEMMLVLKKEGAKKVLGERVQVRALATEKTLQCTNLVEITDAEAADPIKQQCEVDAPNPSIRLRKDPVDTQIVTIKLPAGEVKKAPAVGKIRVGWSVYFK